mmetsp:Transcript_28074/g.46649  ORF Transcript_28074/g.46649 Transcript_28074/m.46649 type:complete len:293 (+) Transcript_28074:1022-1900(+)
MSYSQVKQHLGCSALVAHRRATNIQPLAHLPRSMASQCADVTFPFDQIFGEHRCFCLRIKRLQLCRRLHRHRRRLLRHVRWRVRKDALRLFDWLVRCNWRRWRVVRLCRGGSTDGRGNSPTESHGTRKRRSSGTFVRHERSERTAHRNRWRQRHCAGRHPRLRVGRIDGGMDIRSRLDAVSPRLRVAITTHSLAAALGQHSIGILVGSRIPVCPMMPAIAVTFAIPFAISPVSVSVTITVTISPVSVALPAVSLSAVAVAVTVAVAVASVSITMTIFPLVLVIAIAFLASVV